MYYPNNAIKQYSWGLIEEYSPPLKYDGEPLKA